MKDYNPSVMAIDPGIKGAIAIFTPDTNAIRIYDLPQCTTTVKGKHKVTTDLVETIKMFQLIHEQYSIGYIGLEQVGASPQMGVTSAFTFGQVFGMLKALATAMPGAELHMIPPNKWKARYQLTGKDKKDAIKIARKYFPNMEAIFTTARIDRADAAIMARYLQNKVRAGHFLTERENGK